MRVLVDVVVACLCPMLDGDTAPCSAPHETHAFIYGACVRARTAYINRLARNEDNNQQYQAGLRILHYMRHQLLPCVISENQLWLNLEYRTIELFRASAIRCGLAVGDSVGPFCKPKKRVSVRSVCGKCARLERPTWINCHCT